MPAPRSWIISEPYAGLQAQAIGLAEAAGLDPELRTLQPRAPWRFMAAGAVVTIPALVSALLLNG